GCRGSGSRHRGRGTGCCSPGRWPHLGAARRTPGSRRSVVPRKRPRRRGRPSAAVRAGRHTTVAPGCEGAREGSQLVTVPSLDRVASLQTDPRSRGCAGAALRGTPTARSEDMSQRWSDHPAVRWWPVFGVGVLLTALALLVVSRDTAVHWARAEVTLATTATLSNPSMELGPGASLIPMTTVLERALEDDMPHA